MFSTKKRINLYHFPPSHKGFKKIERKVIKMAVKTNYKKNGKEYYRVTATIGKKSNGNSIRKEFYGKNKKEAEQKRDEYLRNIANGLNTDYKSTKLVPLMELWLVEVIKPSNKVKESTFECYESIFRNYIKTAPFAYYKLNDIKSIMIQKYYNTLFEKGKSSNIIREINLKLNSFFVHAVNQGYMLKNPTEKKRITIPGLSEKKKREIETFSDEEIKIIKDNAENYQYGMLILFALGTGMRQGELLGLKWKYLDLNKKIVTVIYTVKIVTEIPRNGKRKTELKMYTPKTKSSIRTIPIPNALIPKLKQHKIKEKEKCLKYGINFSDENFVFTNLFLNPIRPNNIIVSFQRFLTKTNIPVRKFHTLRHTYATQLFKSGAELLTVSKILGHTNLETTKIYTHVSDKQKEDAVNKLNKIFI